MKRIDKFSVLGNPNILPALGDVADGINEIMDFLEKNVTKKEGKFYRCIGCGHVTYTDGTPICTCKNANFEVIV